MIGRSGSASTRDCIRECAAVCFGTFAATLFLPLAYAVILGVFLNVTLYLRLASQLHLAEMVPVSDGVFIERPLETRHDHGSVVFLQIEGDLFFGVADELQERLTLLLNQETRVVIFRLKRTHSMDSTVLEVFERFASRMRASERHVIFAGVRTDLLDTIRRGGLIDTIGPENVFETGEGIFASAKLALLRTRELIGDSADSEWLHVNGDTINGDEVNGESNATVK